MAEGNLCVVANRILRFLGCEYVKTIGSAQRVPKELLEGLEMAISELAPLLLDAEKKSFENERLKDWLLRLGETLYDADNLLDDFSTESLQQKMISKLMKSLNDLKEIHMKLQLIASDRHEFHLVELSSDAEQFQVVPVEPCSYIVKEEVYGRDDDREAILKLLLDQKEQQQEDVMVLPILGTGGSGKTKLARDIFNVGTVQNHFQVRIWACVSEDADIRETVVKICASNEPSVHTENLSMEQLHRLLRESLHGKWYLIVLDDVWNEDRAEWDQLKHVLQSVGGARGSAIILTSRSAKVAEIAGTVQPFFLGGLSQDRSWNLFQRMAFCYQESKSIEMIRIGQEIVHQCNGHPLLILAIGGMLYFENSEAEWRSFYENDFSRTTSDPDIPSTTKWLKLCYDHLPSTLKHCFAYCSLFPKDHEIDVQTLIQLWMAQGFIQPPTSNQSLEDVGYGYFLNLLRRSFFHEVTMDVKGRVAKCKMHGVMHDLAIYVAGKRCHTFNSRRNFRGNFDRSTSHISFVSGLSVGRRAFPSLVSAKKLRSIMFPSKLRREDRGRYNSLLSDMRRCKFLRALDMHALGITRVPSSIGKLKHLRYLDLSENEHITELPDSITELQNLQTLRLSSCCKLRKFPRDIGNLINLRHLEIDGCYNLASLLLGIARLTNLQTLSPDVLTLDASVHREDIRKLRVLTNLIKKVEIKNLIHGKDDIAADLKVEWGVRSLSLEWKSHAPKLDEDGTPLDGERFSNLEGLTLNGFRGATLFQSTFPLNLVELSLRRWVKGKNLSSLSQCLKLKVLVLAELKDLEYVTTEPISSLMTCFPTLQELWLIKLSKLQGWWKTSTTSVENQEYLPSFPCLSKLVIEDCPRLDSMPLFPTLEEALVLESTCLNSFQLTMKHRLATAPAAVDEASSSSNVPSCPLSKLKNLCIAGIDEFDNSKADEIAWDTLQSLKMLEFDNLKELTSLPHGLRHANFLETLVIRSCPQLKSLPEEIEDWRLKTLEIEDCPILIRRCEEGIGADWDKIKHIQDLHLGR